MCDICICIANPNRTGKNGRILTEWVDIPMTDDEMKAVFHSIGTEVEFGDYFISDAEMGNFDIDIDHHTDLIELNELAKKIDALQGYDSYKLAAYLEWIPHLSLAEITAVIDELDNYDFLSEVYDGRDFERYCIREFGSLNALPPTVWLYADLFKYDNGLSYCLDIYYSSLGVIIRKGTVI